MVRTPVLTRCVASPAVSNASEARSAVYELLRTSMDLARRLASSVKTPRDPRGRGGDNIAADLTGFRCPKM